MPDSEILAAFSGFTYYSDCFLQNELSFMSDKPSNRSNWAYPNNLKGSIGHLNHFGHIIDDIEMSIINSLSVH